MSLLSPALPAGFIEPCLPTSAPSPPSGEMWLHEIKHDGFRVIARKTGERVKLYSRSGNDLTDRFPLIVAAMSALGARSCIIDGKAVACGDDGIASFDRIRHRHYDEIVFLYAFDLIELNGDDLRREPLAVRKATLTSLLGHATLTSLLGRAVPGLRLNEHIEADGPTVFQARLQARPRRDCLEAQGLALYLGTIATLDQIEEPERAGSEAGGRRGLGPLRCLVEFIASIRYKPNRS
jgi:bifunctional non-homologous end joining protein LigD